MIRQQRNRRQRVHVRGSLRHLSRLSVEGHSDLLVGAAELPRQLPHNVVLRCRIYNTEQQTVCFKGVI